MQKIRAYLLFFILSLHFGLTAQTVYLEGNVFSYNSQKLVLIKKAQKNLSFEGPLNNATIKCVGKKNSSSLITGNNGFFSIPMDEPGSYEVTISKSGYSTISFVVNYRSTTKKQYFESVFLILKQEENAILDLGTIEIENGQLALTEGNSKNASSADVFNSNINLLEKAVNINNNDKNGQFPLRPALTLKNAPATKPDSLKQETKSGFSSDKINLARALSTENIDSLKENIENSKNILNGLSPESEDYKMLSLQINLALQKVKDKEKIISLQDSELSNSRTAILYLALFLLFLVISLGVSFYFFREKKQFASALLSINEKISKINSRLLSSIRYASIIQENFLRPTSGLTKLFPDSFLYSRPKDILSGDFHWFSEINTHKIVLVADCTGHGVPGAMLTVLGNRLLDEIICEKGKVKPSEILTELNTSIQETFSSSKEQLDYGIDISIVSLDVKTGELLFSGIGNGIYKAGSGKLDFFAATPKSLGNDLTTSDLEDQVINYKKGDSFYLFSDGYADQFKGNDPNRTKFNLKRFSELILEIEKSKKMAEAPVLFDQRLNEWMGENNIQVDDICILGFRL